jgi:hypothetical protein
MRHRNAAASDHRDDCLPGAAQVQMVLQKLPKQLRAILVQQPLQLSVGHLHRCRASQPRGQLVEYAPGLGKGLLFRLST